MQTYAEAFAALRAAYWATHQQNEISDYYGGSACTDSLTH